MSYNTCVEKQAQCFEERICNAARHQRINQSHHDMFSVTMRCKKKSAINNRHNSRKECD